ncbi:MAG: glycosyltransferase [Oscillatoria sp. PMC 1051.18]|nr:glycosyltransferase [Oscillatoria sp. PMC 1050.18]MEC5032558.1 glycosyltransferase [Oscillatoria sp. PMC 1051.18]
MTTENTIKIFVGTEEEQILAVKVLEYSIRKHTKLPVEIKPLFVALREAGISIPTPKDPTIRPKTPFSFQRFAIPALTGYQGKAIYLDSDMQVFRDIQEIWSMPFQGADLLSVAEPANSGRPPQFSVMLLNCEQLKWDAPELVRQLEAGKWTYQQFVLEMAPAEKISATLPLGWNDLERYDSEKTALTHYTDMPKQPWLNYQNPLGWLWCQDLFNAVKDGFITQEFISEQVKKGWVRPSLLYQLKHNIIDPLQLPKKVIAKDEKEFIPPYAVKKQLQKITHDSQTPPLIKHLARQLYILARNIWQAKAVQFISGKFKRRFS